MHIHVHIHNDSDEEIKTILKQILQNQNKIMTDLTGITAAVENETTVDQSIITLLNNIAAELKAAGTDQAALDALTQKITANSQAIADAVTANTTTE